MIIPGSQDFKGYIGSTFDTVITVYPSADANLNWTGAWSSLTPYNIGDVAIGTDNNAYEALKASTGINPIGVSSSWSATPVTPMNLNNWSGTIILAAVAANEFTQTPTLTTPLVIQGVQGTLSIKFTSTQTSTMVPGTLHQWITMNDPSGNTYYYLNGAFTWVSP